MKKMVKQQCVWSTAKIVNSHDDEGAAHDGESGALDLEICIVWHSLTSVF